jgi:hypothetical protein
MAVTITVGFSRKVGEPNYGSRGASLHLEVELDRSALDDPERFRSEVESMFERTREAVNQELHRDSEPALESGRPMDGPSDHDPPESGCCRAARSATPNQIRAIQKIARHRPVTLSQLLHTRFGGRTLEELSIVEASLLIDQLQSPPTNGDRD